MLEYTIYNSWLAKNSKHSYKHIQFIHSMGSTFITFALMKQTVLLTDAALRLCMLHFHMWETQER